MKREAPMNIPEFATVLTAVMRHNMRLHDEGVSIKDYLVPMAWADPGLGKSDIAEAVADDLGWEMVYADLATRDPAELGGMPWVTDGRTVRCRPDWLPTEGRGILFLDELPQAGLANLNIAATLIREHRIGEHRLPPTWMVACAGNYQHNRAGTTTMPSHVRNRLLHLDINADANAWAKWASARGINPMLIAYNRYRAQEYHHKFSATDNAYPTPRSWTASHQVLRLDLPEALKRECTGGMIGPGAGADFAGFCDILRQPAGCRCDHRRSRPRGHSERPDDEPCADGRAELPRHVRQISPRSCGISIACRSRNTPWSASSTRPRAIAISWSPARIRAGPRRTATC